VKTVLKVKKTFYKFRYLAISHNVEDSKGNPGIKGHFFITNLRVIWNAASDRDLNLSVGNFHFKFRT
jgi:hypothetical protein